MLTTAARRTNADGSACDFADFLAYVLAVDSGERRRSRTSFSPAEMGPGKRVWCGRWSREPWATTRWNLLRLRTEPVVVTLNVAELLEGLNLPPRTLMTVDEAISACEERFREGGPR